MSKVMFKNIVTSFAPVKEFSEQEIIDEPMIFGGSVSYCLEHGGPITKEILHNIVNNDIYDMDVQNHAKLGYHPVIDTKVVMLMPGQYPCIPGWHCDGVIRKDKSSQPDLGTISQPIRHYVMTASTHPEGVSNTLFLSEPCDIEVSEKGNIWGEVNKKVEQALEEGRINTFETTDNIIYRFRRDTLHTGAPCKNRGWRYFFRLSFYHMPCMNEIRKQVQIYANPNEGW